MPQSSQNGNDVFDVRRIKRLVELMQENELTELDIQQKDMRIQLKRNTPVIATAPIGPPMPVAASPVVPTGVPAVPPEPVEELNVHVVKSPMVGTFYSAANPEAPPFVKVGDSVNPDKTVCLIEAMKVYNEIQAECSGKIVAILATNAQTVEFGTPLFKVRIE